MAAVVKFDYGQWDSAIKNTLNALVRKDDLLRRAFNIFGIKDLIEHFRDQRGPKDAWKPRAQATQDAYARILAGLRKPGKGTARAAYDPSNLILQLTGNLRKSLLNPSIRTKSGDTIEVYSESPYGAAHDEGSSKRGLPQREFMWLSDDAQENMTNAILETVMKGGLE